MKQRERKETHQRQRCTTTGAVRWIVSVVWVDLKYTLDCRDSLRWTNTISVPLRVTYQRSATFSASIQSNSPTLLRKAPSISHSILAKLDVLPPCP